MRILSPVDREKQSQGKAPGPRALGPRGPEPWGETPSFSWENSIDILSLVSNHRGDRTTKLEVATTALGSEYSGERVS